MGTSTPGAVVLGLSYTGIGAVHSLAELSPRPQPIVAVTFKERAARFRSKLAVTVLVPPPSRDGGIAALNALRTITRGSQPCPVLLATEDDWVSFVSRWQAELSPYFRFSIPEQSAVQVLLDKARVARLATSLGIPCAEYAVITAGRDIPAPDGIAVPYPLVAKTLTSLQEDPHHGTLRVRFFNSHEEWRECFTDAPTRPGPVMIQRNVPGDDSMSYTYEGLWSDRGEEICAFSAQKLRQEPPQYGAATFAVSRYVPNIVERSRRLLREIGYRGLVDVDFKRSAEDGEFYIMEVNPRLGGLHRLGSRLGCDLVQAAYRSLCGQSVAPFDPATCRRRTWCLMGQDLSCAYRLCFSNPLRAIRRLMSYLSCPKDALFCSRDPRPWMDSIIEPITRGSCQCRSR